MKELEDALKSLIRGKYSSLVLSMNDYNGPNYMTVADVANDNNWPADWVSEEEKQKSIATNCMWVLHWYPDTPIGFHAIAGSSIASVVAEALRISEEDH